MFCRVHCTSACVPHNILSDLMVGLIRIYKYSVGTEPNWVKLSVTPQNTLRLPFKFRPFDLILIPFNSKIILLRRLLESSKLCELYCTVYKQTSEQTNKQVYNIVGLAGISSRFNSRTKNTVI